MLLQYNLTHPITIQIIFSKITDMKKKPILILLQKVMNCFQYYFWSFRIFFILMKFHKVNLVSYGILPTEKISNIVDLATQHIWNVSEDF